VEEVGQGVHTRVVDLCCLHSQFLTWFFN
jgi:hypothetical protein